MSPGTMVLLLKPLHVALAAGSVTLFGLRGLSVLAGATWPTHRRVRTVSMCLDTLLLAAGATLWWLLALNPVRDAWLGAKLVLVLTYIVFGSLALKRAPGRGAKSLALVAALVTAAMVATIALHHDARAPLRWLGVAPAGGEAGQ